MVRIIGTFFNYYCLIVVLSEGLTINTLDLILNGNILLSLKYG